MEIIKKEINESQKKLSKVNLDFMEFVEKNPDSLKISGFKSLGLNDDLFTLQPWPTFINHKMKETFREAGIKLFDLIKGIPKRIFNNDPGKMSVYYEQPLEDVEIQLDGVDDNHIDKLVGRGDFILSSSGLKCLEYNVAASMGGWQIPVWEFMYLNNPIIARFLKDYPVKIKNENLFQLFLEHVVDSTLSKVPGCDNEINMAFVSEGIKERYKNTTVMYLDKLLKEILHRKNKDLEGSVFLCDYRNLDLVDNCLFYKDNRVHVLTEMYLGYVSFDVMEAFKAGNITLINGPISSLLSNKLNLALLSDYETGNVFTQEEKKIINTYVPWTRKITPGNTTYGKERIHNLERFILSNRETLVIKPGTGFGGKGVCVGRKSSEKEWEEALKTAIKEKSWLVQELVESSPGLYQAGETGCEPHDMVWGFFIFGSRCCGAWNRVMTQKSNKGVINCHQGATVSIIFEVDE
jgi:hypothetical protein